MREKHKFRRIKRKLDLEGDMEEEKMKIKDRKEKNEVIAKKKIPVFDIILEQSEVSFKYQNLETIVGGSLRKTKHKISHVLDITLNNTKVKPYELPDTEVIIVQPKFKKRRIHIFDPVLSSSTINPYPIDLDTTISRQMLVKSINQKRKN